MTSETTAADGSFSVSVSPGTYDVSVDYPGDSTDPAFGICTDNVDLTKSVDDTLSVPITQLTVTAENSNGDLLQGATIPANTQEIGFLAAFDFFPGQPIDNNSYLLPDQAHTTGAAGTATIPLMPLTSPLFLAVDPPAGSALAPTTISTGTMTTNTAVTATLAGPVPLSGVLKDSLGNEVAGATVGVYPPGTGCARGAVTSETTAADGSFSVSVSPGTYDVSVDYPGDSTDPAFGICTDNVDLTKSVDDTLSVPITQLTVTAENSNGDLLQGATIPANTQEIGFLAAFDFFPGQPIDNNSYLLPDQAHTTGAAGTATIPLMPLTSPLFLAVDPPAGSALAPTTISTGTMTTNTAVTATLAETSGAPPPPTGVTATPGDGSAIVSWTAPTLQSDSLTGYTATATPGDESCTTTGATTCTITGLTNGVTYTVTVVAHTTAGDSGPSAPATVTPLAQKSAISSTSITSTTASPVVGQPITTTVQVSGQSADATNPTPTGTVTVSDGTQSCQATLSGSNGLATGSCQITEQAPGSYTFTASYPGDANFTASHATAAVVAVRATSSTTMTISPASLTYGNEKSLNLTVTVTPQFAGTATGVVIITAGQTRLCTAKLASGTGSCSPRSDTILSAGKATLIAAYDGSADFLRSSSAPATLHVTKAKSHVSLTLSQAAIAYGNERSLKASVTVTPQYSGTPRGVVIIAVGQTTLCTIKPSSGTGSCSPSSQKTLRRGKHLVVASYQGSADFSQSSASKTVVVRNI